MGALDRSSDNLQTREARSFVAIKLTSICGFILQIERARNFYKVLVKKLRVPREILGEGLAEGPPQHRANRSTLLTVILS